MPSKNGFGNSRTPMTKKVSYGSAVHYKNPIMKKKEKVKLTESEKTGSFINDFVKLRKKKKEVKFMGGIENYNEAKGLKTAGTKGGSYSYSGKKLKEIDDMAYRRMLNK